MPIKLNQIKKLSVKVLKAVVKANKLGKITKMRKIQLVGMLMSANNVQEIISKLSLPIKKKRPPSAKQLLIRKAFGDRMRKKGKKKTSTVVVEKPLPKMVNPVKIDDFLPEVIKLPEKIKLPPKFQIISADLKPKDMAMDDGGMPIVVSKEGKEKMAVAKKLNDKIVKEVVMKMKPQRISKRMFLDNVFGECKFCIKLATKNLMEELSDEQMDKFFDMPKKRRNDLLSKRFNGSMSMASLVRKFN